MAVGTVTLTSKTKVEIGSGATARRCDVVQLDFVASSTDGTLPVLQVPLSGYLLKVVTNPGSTAPTDNWDIVLGDPEDNALDAAASLLLNRHTTTTQQVYPNISGAAIPIFLAGTYAVTISGNSVNSATGRILLYLIDSL